MEKLDLSDKYIHSPNWDDNRDLTGFQEILRSGYLLTPLSSGVHTRYYKDRIFFAVHPYGQFSDDYPESGLACFSNTDGYDMASNGVFFILNSKLREDYDLQPVKYKHECATCSNVDLFKYLVGIGNAGFDISDELIYCYYFIKYSNNEIPASKVIEIVQERNLRTNLVTTIESISKSINSLYLPEYNYLYHVLATDVDSLISTKQYYEILRILDEESIKIGLYDRYGYPIDPKSRLEEVRMMYAYLEEYRKIKMGSSYFKKIDELCDIAGNQMIRKPTSKE